MHAINYEYSYFIKVYKQKNLKKQLAYADKKGCSLAVICGENEFKENTVTVKNLKGVKGENNKTFPKANLIDEIKKLI